MATPRETIDSIRVAIVQLDALTDAQLEHIARDLAEVDTAIYSAKDYAKDEINPDGTERPI